MDAVVSVRVIRPYVLALVFADGSTGEVDIEPLLFGEIFEPLRDPDRFTQAGIDDVFGAVVWPNGADISPEWLRGHIVVNARHS